MGGAESSKRMLCMLLDSQAEVVVKATFATWRDFVVAAKLDRIREASSKMRSKEQESQRRMLSMLVGSQGSLLLKTSFSALSECIYELKRLREVEQMRKNMRAKGDESTKRMLGMLMNSQTEVLIKASFAGWLELTVEERTRKMRENLSALKNKKEEGNVLG